MCDFVSVTENRCGKCTACFSSSFFYLCLLHLFTHTRVSKDILAALKWEGCASGEAASESCFSRLPSVTPPPSCSDAALFSNWMTNCCVCGLRGHESGVPTMRWRGVIGTTIAVSLLCFTPLWTRRFILFSPGKLIRAHQSGLVCGGTSHTLPQTSASEGVGSEAQPPRRSRRQARQV